MPNAAPPAGAGGPPSTIVLVRSAIAPLHAEPRVSSPQISQALAGHPLLVLDAHGSGWQLVAGADGYAGWVHDGYVARPERAELVASVGADPTIVTGAAVPSGTGPGAAGWRVVVPAREPRARTSLGCTAARAGGPARPLPLGAWLLPHERVADGAALAAADLAARFPADAPAVAASAATLFAGASYQWGGVTPWGADCSGFVQLVYGLHGRPLPRDAWQQALEGEEAGTSVAELRPADLLFFSDRADGRVTHVGVALGGSRMAHVALGRGGFAVERLDDDGDPYVANLVRQLRHARRVLTR